MGSIRLTLALNKHMVAMTVSDSTVDIAVIRAQQLSIRCYFTD